MTGTLLSLGHGYSARALARQLLPRGWRIIGTTRSDEKAAALEAEGIEPRIWPDTDLTDDISAATHILANAGPQGGSDTGGDPFLDAIGDQLRAARPVWVGYLSTTGVYGDHGGDWVDENTPLAPSTERGRLRVAAETAWCATGLPLHVFRLAGIYGPGRGPFAKLRAGRARRIIKPGQVFSRIHVEDIAQTLAASMAQPDPGRVYNLCDDDPAPPQNVIAYAAQLLNLPEPPAIAFDEAEMSTMARSFYAESKKVRNERIKQELGVRLFYPDYRSGLTAEANGG